MTKAVESLFVIHLISQNCISINSFSEQLQLCFPLQHKKIKHSVSKSWSTFLFAVRSPEKQPNTLKWILRRPRLWRPAAVSHRHRWIVEGKNELERLICGRADIFCPSSSKHPLRDNITGGTHLVVNSKKKKKKQEGVKSTLLISSFSLIYSSRLLLFTSNWHH